MVTENDNPKFINVQLWGIGSDGLLYPLEKTTQEETSAYLSMATAASAIVYDVPTGKQFRIRTILFANVIGGTGKTLWLTNGSGLSYTKIPIVCGSTVGQVFLNDIKGLVFDSDIYVQASSFSNGMALMVAGELESKESATE